MRYIAFIFLFLLPLNIHAKTIEEIAEEAHIASINALLIFTSQKGLNSGLYNFTNVGVDMEVYSLPLRYDFTSSSKINYFIVGNVGYSRVYISQEIEIPESSRLTYNNHLRTYTGGIGGGIRYKINANLGVSVGTEFIYSKSGASVKKSDDGIGDAISDFFKKNYNNNLSYKFFTDMQYRTLINGYKPYVDLSYKMYDTKSSFTFNDLSSFSSESSVTSISLGAESPSVLNFGVNDVTLEAYLNANYIDGKIEEAVKFSVYSTLGAVVYLNTPKKEMWIKRFFLEVNKVYSVGLNGHNVGIGFSVDF